MFKPDEVIFASTSQCNLECEHCRVERMPSNLAAKDAIKFLKSCRPSGIEKVGFSGGEPFLRPEFLYEVCEAAVELDMYFDRLMTNGVWFKNEARLREVLEELHESGFDGTFGVSVDSYHVQDVKKLAVFFRTAFIVWGRKDCCEIISVRTEDEAAFMKKLETLSGFLGGKIVRDEDGEPIAIANKKFLERKEDDEDDPEALIINIASMSYSAAAEEEAWDADEWFEDDFCAGPGNVLYVHPNGNVAPCCGFANENEALKIGNIKRDNCARVLAKAAENPIVAACYDEGLATVRKRVMKKEKFPGKTDDMCFFCDWMCKNRT